MMKRSGKTEEDEPKRSKDDDPVAKRTRSSAKTLPGSTTSTRVVNTCQGSVKMPTRWPNPFLQGPVIRSLVKQIEKASELKIVRRLNQDWDLIGVQELEHRAIMGKLKKIDFNWSLNTTSEAKEELSEFLKDTQNNLKLFRGFAFNFPNALAPFHSVKSGAFLRQYSPLFIEIIIPYHMKFEKNEINALFLDCLRWVSQSLRELTLSLNDHENTQGLGRLPVPSGQWEEPLIFPNLERIESNNKDYDEYDDRQISLLTGFKLVVLGNGKMRNSTPKLKSIILNIIKDKSLEELLGICPEYPDISRWINLTQIEIQRVDYVPTLDKFITCLLSLARSGMALTSLTLNQGIHIFQPGGEGNLARICDDFTQFFATHAKSLKNLEFQMHFLNSVLVDHLRKIEFPVFENLTHLSLWLGTHKIWVYEGETFDIIPWRGWAELFPQLKHLTLHYGEEVEAILSRNVDPGEEKLSLKYLEVINYPRLDFGNYIQSLDIFKCHFRFLRRGGEEIPWVDSLQNLIIMNVRGTLKLAHLNGLKELIVEEECKIKGDNFERFLGFFDGVASLNLKSIKFRISKSLEEIIKKEFAKKFPFPVEFENNDASSSYYELI